MSDGPLPNVPHVLEQRFGLEQRSGLEQRFRPDAAVLQLLPIEDHPSGCDCERCTPRLYRPSNGTEGEIFAGAWCARCQRDHAGEDPDFLGCEILGRTFIFPVQDPNYPREWRYGGDGETPVCTAFVEVGEEIAEPLDAAAVGMLL